MRAGIRLAVGGLILAAWGLWAGPRLSHALLQLRALRSTTISIPTLELAWNELESKHAAVFDDEDQQAEVELETAAIQEMSLLEEQLVSSIWAQINNTLKPEVLAIARANPDPPPLYDPRYVDPYAPALIQAVINGYGYRRLSAPLPDVRSATSSHTRPERLLSAQMLIERQALDQDAAARILDAALRLTVAQRARVTRERRLSNRLPAPLRNLAAQMHAEGRHLER